MVKKAEHDIVSEWVSLWHLYNYRETDCFNTSPFNLESSSKSKSPSFLLDIFINSEIYGLNIKG